MTLRPRAFLRLRKSRSLPVFLVAALGGALEICGCGSGRTQDVSPPPPPPPPPPAAAFSGHAMTGIQPLAGAAIQLYAAGATGPGSAASALLSATVTTDAAGAFSIPATYVCPSAATQVFLVARGGQAGSVSASNPATVLIDTIGLCGQLASSSSFVVNELTTAATAWAMSQFLSPGANLGASATNALGLANAQATAASLVDPAKGTAPGPAFPANGTAPIARLNSLANLLHFCAASSASNTTTDPCGRLFLLTTVPGSPVPTNILDAALNLVRNPGVNVLALYTQSQLATAFSPALVKAPADWTLFVNFTGGGMNSPSGVGVDSTGSVWVGSYFSVASKFTPLGAPVFPAGITGFGLFASYSLAIDAQDDVWIPNEPGFDPQGAYHPGNSVTVLNSSGQSISGPLGFSPPGLNYPLAIAIDPNTNVWIVNYGNSTVSLLTSAGTVLRGPEKYTFAFPIGVAVDANHSAWVTNQTGGTLDHIAPDGSSQVAVRCCEGAAGVAVDQAGNAWVADYYASAVSEVTSSNVVLSNGLQGGGLNHPQGVAIDGAGAVWVTNFQGDSISKLAGASSATPGAPLSPPAGFASEAGLLDSVALAIDASGNVWVTNFGSRAKEPFFLTQIIGLAAPVKTPLLGPPRAP